MALITVQQVMERTSIGGNVDSDKLTHLIDDIEFMQIEPILGTKLYDKIVTDFNANNLAGDYATIYNDYLIRIMCFLTYAEYLRDGIIIASNGGIFTLVPEGAENANIDDIEYVAKRNQSKADTLIDRLIHFLCDKNIPEYDESQDNDYDVKPDYNISNIGGWYLQDKPRFKDRDFYYED